LVWKVTDVTTKGSLNITVGVLSNMQFTYRNFVMNQNKLLSSPVRMT